MTVPFTFANATGNVPLAELDANFASVANNVSSANIALTAGTVTTNAQPNITSVGTLTGLSVAGTVTANLFVGNIAGSITNALYAATAGIVTTPAQLNINQVGVLSSLSTTGNIRSGPVIVTGFISSTGTCFAGNLLTTGNIGVTAGVTTLRLGNNNPTTVWIGGDATNIIMANANSVTTASGNLRAGGYISAAGNVIGNFFIGDGSQLTGVAATNVSGNALTGDTLSANIIDSTLTSVGTLNSLSVIGNITTTNGTFNGNLNATGAIRSGNLSVTGSISSTGSVFAGNLLTSGNIGVTAGVTTLRLGNTNPTTLWIGGDATNLYLANVNSTTRVAGNLSVGADISATGNITGNYFIGNGSLLTGISNGVSSYGNANVAANLAAFGSNPISTTGNVTAGNFIGNVVGGGAGTPTISSTTNLDLSAAAAVRVIGGGTFRLPNLTTAQIANLTAANGDMVYNTTTTKIQAYANGAWGNITLT